MVLPVHASDAWPHYPTAALQPHADARAGVAPSRNPPLRAVLIVPYRCTHKGLW